MNRTERTLWPLLVALLLLAAGCGAPADAGTPGTPETPGSVETPGSQREGGAAMANGGSDSPGASGIAEPHGAHDHAAPGDMPAANATEHSVYVLPSSWRDRHGRDVALDDLAGRVQVVAMVYTHCTFACPRILAQMKRLEAGVADAARSDRVGFTLVSLDPERDTPGRLAEFGESVRLDGERWTLLTGSDDDVRALSVLLGVKYRANDDGTIDHSNVITVLDEDGVPIHRIEGLDADTGPALAAILDRIE